VHALFVTILLVGGVAMLVGGESVVRNALGRNENLGRTDIWAASIAAAGNPVIGTGFESFWNANSAKVGRVLMRIGYWDESNLNTAHNGYIEVYLELGWVGVGLIGIILISGYRRAFMAFKRNPEVGGLSLAYLATAAIYSVTEAGFRVMTPSWFFLLLAVVGAEGVVFGVFDGVAPEPSALSPAIAVARLAGRKLALNPEERSYSRHPAIKLRSPLKGSRT
jgi:exopolysaccharide production protein ExoQ